MDNTLPEIIKLKNNLMMILNRLIFTSDVNQEISIIDEMKKEIENLLTLINKKKNNPSLCQNSMNSNMNLFNPIMTPNFNNNYNNQFQQMLKQEMEKMNQYMLNYIKGGQQNNVITVFFNKEKFIPIMCQCFTNEKVDNLIDRYRMRSLDMDKTEKFIFNFKPLLPDLTVAQAGLTDNSIIYVQGDKG